MIQLLSVECLVRQPPSRSNGSMLRLLLFAATLFAVGLLIPHTDANQQLAINDDDSSSSQVIDLNLQDAMRTLRRMKRQATKRKFFLIIL